METYAIIDPRLPEQVIQNLNKSGFMIITVPLITMVDEPLSGHPDIQMFLHDNNLFVHPDIDNLFLKKIENKINIIQCSTKLNRIYPGDIPYNIACAGKTAIHKKASADSTISDYLFEKKIDMIETKQGYSKCSTLIVNDQSIITADNSIHKAAVRSGLDSLLIANGFIDLPGYKYGFIGGASGKFNDTIYLTGSINHHPDKERMEKFIESKGMKLNILSNQKIFDAGSIFFID